MVPTTFLLQGITEDNHLTIVNQIVQIPDPARIVLCVAFLNESGVVALQEALAPVAAQTTIFAGIRNGITSAQGLSKSLELGCTTYAVDTGSSNILFHPKVYLSRNANEAKLMIGSANLTVGGLNSNIEASLFMELDLTKPEHCSIVDSVEAKIDGMLADYPAHVFRVTSNAEVEELLVAGRVVEEHVRQAGLRAGSSSNRELDTVTRMPLHTRQINRHRPEPFPRTVGEGAVPEVEVPDGVVAPIQERLNLVWRSKPLSRRDLNVPEKGNTKRTGSMLLKRGDWEGIDHRHYFRDTVFAALHWTPDPKPNAGHRELAVARFHLVIRGVDYGIYPLTLSHDNRINTRAYEQRNGMTHLRWGIARRDIAHEDLLGRTLFLYRDTLDDSLFGLEID